MALQPSRVGQEADAIALVSNKAANLLVDLIQVLEHNADLAIAWTFPASFSFTAANATEIFTATAHGQATGQKVRVSSTLTLPAGLLAGTDYYLTTVTANTFQLSLSPTNGSVVAITTDGTGTLTCQPVPNYINLEANGNLEGKFYTATAVSNAIGSLDWIRKLLQNQTMTGSQGDHLGNINQLAAPLG